jgi:hypothetical protein
MAEAFTVFYVGGENLNRPYLHPLRSASGRIVNRSFPAGQLPGETADHPHHAGLFYGHGDVNGYNYWAIENVPRALEGQCHDGPDRAEVASVKSGKESGSVEIVLMADARRQAAVDRNAERLLRTPHAPHHRLRLISGRSTRSSSATPRARWRCAWQRRSTNLPPGEAWRAREDRKL